MDWQSVAKAARRVAGAHPRRQVAVVVQRFGDGLLGGAEWHARALIAALAEHHDVTVLTSCAADASTWSMHFEPGEHQAGNVRVLRFAHPLRNAAGRARVARRHKLRFLLRHVIEYLGFQLVTRPTGDGRSDGIEYLQRQGPFCSGLVDELASGKTRYDVTIFVTALYFPTAVGLPAWGKRSILVPTLHDEKAMYLPWFHRVFAAAGLTLFNTAAERDLAQLLYGGSVGDSRVVGAGVVVRSPTAEQVVASRQRFGLPERYLIYVGRIEKGKGCGDLLVAWLSIASQVSDAALVFVGKGDLTIAESRQVHCTGFVDDADRDALVAGAAALLVPSRFESLSLVLLEAFALGVPAVVNARCPVLEDHVRASGAGEACGASWQWRQAMLRSLERTPDERQRLGTLGRRYVMQRYSWDTVCASWFDAVEQVSLLPRRGDDRTADDHTRTAR